MEPILKRTSYTIKKLPSMMTRPLLLVEDDLDDQELIMVALQELGVLNPVRHFKDAESALNFLRSEEELPFLIVSDVNMPRVSGLDFKGHIESSIQLKMKKIPFVFLSTAATDNYVSEAFLLNAQGFFVKGSSFNDLKNALKTILDYWTRTKHPN
jgi:CheY-like chemotaxis protein